MAGKQENRFAADAKQFGSAMGQIAHSQAMMAAVRDYKKEVLTEEGKLADQADQVATYNMAELVDDPELQKLHADRLAQMQKENEKRAAMQRKGHGTCTDVPEGEFLEVVTQTDMVVAHFCHKEFERCKIMDKHINALCRKYFKTRFIKVHAPDAPFFTVKLNVKMLPCVLGFKGGINVGRIVGFDGLSVNGKDDWPTEMLEDRLLEIGAIEEIQINHAKEEDERIDGPRQKIRRAVNYNKTESDEDSDLD